MLWNSLTSKFNVKMSFSALRLHFLKQTIIERKMLSIALRGWLELVQKGREATAPR